MKASLKFREGQKPLVRAKIPLNILGLPLVSGISAGDSKELCLHLGTFWEAGPALKLAYKPNDSWNPFSLIVKTGIGLWGSPAEAAMAMTAEISMLGRGNPSFCLQFKPQVGDFTVKKYTRSSLVLPSKQGEEACLSGGNAPEGHKSGSQDFAFSKEGSPSSFPWKINAFEQGPSGKQKEEEGLSSGKTAAELENGVGTLVQNGGFVVNIPETNKEEKPPKNQFSEGVGNLKEFPLAGAQKLIQGLALTANSSLPVRDHARLRIKWGVKFPSDLFKGWEGGDHHGFSGSKLPYLLLDKISIENVEQARTLKNRSPYDRLQAPFENLMLPIIREEANELAYVTGMCYSMKRQLHLLQAENKVLKKAMEDMKSEFEQKGIRYSTDKFPDAEVSSRKYPFEESYKKDRMRESNYKESEKKKGSPREAPKKDHYGESKSLNVGLDTDFSTSAGSPSLDVSEELKKAIRNASGSLSDKSNTG